MYNLIRETKRKARKSYQCIWCGEWINIGDQYVHEFSTFGGDIQSHHWHPECRESSADYFAYNGPEFDAYENERPSA